MNVETCVSWIGVGRIGGPMARHLVNAGLRVKLYDRRPEAANAIAAGKAVVASSAAECLAGASIVFTSLPNDTALEQVVLNGDGALARCAGAVLVETSTISPQLSQRVAEACIAHGVDYVRLPVSGNPAIAEQARLSAYASGPREAWERVQPIASLFSASQTYMGSGDEARYMKLVLNCLVANFAPLMAESLTLGRRGGIGWKSMLNAIGASPLCSPWLKPKLAALENRDFSATFPPYMIVKDVDLMLDAARELGVTMPMTAATRQRMQGMCAEPFREEDFFALVKVVERDSGMGDIPC
jgi:3-hydroxyisobutyrate dehydrogenase-like beta-hydroxyacid dehydrogenase